MDAPARPNCSLPMLALQLLLVLWVVRAFELEERRGLFALLVLATFGMLIHSRLSARWRPRFFLAVSLASFPLAFAWPLVADAGIFAALTTGCVQSAWVFGLGLLLIATCHMPLTLRTRVGLLAVIVGSLVAWRQETMEPFWAVLGSIFMFRLWIYLKALEQESAPAPWSQRLTYFFLLSNGFFPFFPIIDYQKFRDGYVTFEDGSLKQRGVAWILLGIIHLLLYRAIKTFLLPGPMDLIDAEYLALFLVTNYALYLRISGHFHIITGLLHLFGYDLPRTHDRYFLASSLSDIWRRINIYWKDFLADHVFFPVYFAVARLPRGAAIVVGVLATFAATWLLHSWQVFWLLGDFPIGSRDAALWFSAGSLVAINSLWQYHRAARRTVKSSDVTVTNAFRLSTQVAATFLTVSFFWACWTMPQFPQLVISIAGSGGFETEQLLRLAGVLIGAIVAGTMIQLIADRLGQHGLGLSLPLERSPVLCLAGLGLLTLVSTTRFQTALGPPVSTRLAALSTEAQSAAQLGQQVDGYYEALAEVNLQADPLLGTSNPNRPRAAGDYWQATRPRNDVLETELIPGWRGEVQGVPFHVNRWGMRDDDVPRRKPPKTVRVAVFGSSVTMGYGVAQDADFESLVERRVNESLPPGGQRVEFLNFAMGQHDCLSAAGALQVKALRLEPDVALFVVDQTELLVAKRLAKANYLKYALPYPCLDAVIRQAGVTDQTSWGTTGALLQQQLLEIVSCIYRGIVADCHQRGITPVWIYLPMPGIEQVPVDTGQQLKGIAQQAGFIVIDLSTWTNDYSYQDLMADEYHPNTLGHRVIADALFGALQRQPLVLPLLLTGSERR